MNLEIHWHHIACSVKRKAANRATHAEAHGKWKERARAAAAGGGESDVSVRTFGMFRIVSFCVYCLSNVLLNLFRIFFFAYISQKKQRISVEFFGLGFQCVVSMALRGKRTQKKLRILLKRLWEKRRSSVLYHTKRKQVLVVATVVHLLCVHPQFITIGFFVFHPLIVLSRASFTHSFVMERDWEKAHEHTNAYGKRIRFGFDCFAPLNILTIAHMHAYVTPILLFCVLLSLIHKSIGLFV